jgi:aspartate aminotransferase-like enzyme
MNPKLWIPGPTEVRPEILAASAAPMIGHRTAACSELVASVDPGLRLAFGLTESSTSTVAVHTCSATGLMEAALRGSGPRILAVVGGAFAKRWAEIAERLGKDVVRLDVEWGRAVEPDALRTALAAGPFDAVTLVVNETSTGVRTSLAATAEVLADFPSSQLLCDVVSLLAGGPVDFDEHHIDFALAGVQKALALPPGIAVCCASERYLEGARQANPGSYYLDPVTFIDGHVARKTPSTPALGSYFALRQQLDDITSGATLPEAQRHLTGAAAWQARFDKHIAMQARTVAWAATRGLALLPPAAEASPTVSCIRAGALDIAALTAGLLERGLAISNGYGPLKGQTFRIGHMGDHTEDGLAELLAAADEILGAPSAM